MADIQTIDVSALAEATGVEQTDTLLLIRQTAEGTRDCKRIAASRFKGEDAYKVAQKLGFAGSYDDWVAHVDAVRKAGIDFDAATGEIVISN